MDWVEHRAAATRAHAPSPARTTWRLPICSCFLFGPSETMKTWVLLTPLKCDPIIIKKNDYPLNPWAYPLRLVSQLTWARPNPPLLNATPISRGMIQSRMSSTGFPSAPLDLGSSSTRPGMPASSSTPPPTTTSAHRKSQSGSTVMTSANQRRAACKKKHRRFFVVGFLWYIFVLDPLLLCLI
jgi:hypothetical protein